MTEPYRWHLAGTASGRNSEERGVSKSMAEPKHEPYRWHLAGLLPSFTAVGAGKMPAVRGESVC